MEERIAVFIGLKEIRFRVVLITIRPKRRKRIQVAFTTHFDIGERDRTVRTENCSLPARENRHVDFLLVDLRSATVTGRTDSSYVGNSVDRGARRYATTARLTGRAARVVGLD